MTDLGPEKRAGLTSAGHTLWGLGYFYLQYFLAVGRVVPAPEFAAQDAHPAAMWGFYWYAVFLVWGLSLGIAAWRTHTGGSIRFEEDCTVRGGTK